MNREVAKERLEAVVRILKDEALYDRIAGLYNDDVAPDLLAGKETLKVCLHIIIGYQVGDTDFQQKFEQLQNSNLTYDTLSDEQEGAVKSLSGNELFVKEFENMLPAEPVTDGSSTDDSDTKKRNKRRKKWDVTKEVVEKTQQLRQRRASTSSSRAKPSGFEQPS